MDTTNLETQVLEFISAKVENIGASEITTASQFAELGFDSMDTIQLLFDAEEKFGISFDGDEVKNFRNVGDIIEYIRNHPTTPS